MERFTHENGPPAPPGRNADSTSRCSVFVFVFSLFFWWCVCGGRVALSRTQRGLDSAMQGGAPRRNAHLIPRFSVGRGLRRLVVSCRGRTKACMGLLRRSPFLGAAQTSLHDALFSRGASPARPPPPLHPPPIALLDVRSPWISALKTCVHSVRACVRAVAYAKGPTLSGVFARLIAGDGNCL